MSLYESAGERVVATCRELLDRGYLKSTEGNVSVRVPGRTAFAITPSGQEYASMRAQDICVLDERLRPAAGTLKASIEAGMHAAVYRCRPDVNAIIHTHQQYASALALIRKPIPALFDEQARYLGRSVDVIPYAPSGTSFLKRRVTAKVKSGANAFILANHGVLVLGGDTERAIHNMALLEKCALAYLLALLTEQPVSTIPKAIREIALAQLKGDEKKLAAQMDRTGRREVSPAPVPPTAALMTAPAMIESAAGYAISRYPDAEAVNARLHALVRQPLRRVKRAAMAEYLDYFDARCRRSKELTDTAGELIPGGVQHNLAFNYPFPIAVDRAEGAYLWDVDGNRYVDFLQAGGPTVLGSNYAPVHDKVVELLQSCGPVTGLFHEYELKLAELLARFMPSVEMFRMFGSGTEGAMAAIRAARTFTGHKNVVKMGGAYHGWSDQLVYGLHVPGTRRFEAKGIPRGATKHTAEVYPNDLDALCRRLKLNKARGGTAAVLLEPIGPESGTRPVPLDFNRHVRELCEEFDALLIFDEVVTGFRLGMGGAQGYFGVRPDLTVFGKCISGGYPMAGGVGGRREVMLGFASGIGGKSGERAYVGGTLSANPLSCAAGYFALLEMERTNAPVLAGKAGDRLTAGLDDIISRFRLPYVAYNQGSIVHLETSGVMLLDLKHPIRLARGLKPRKHAMEEMGAAYMANGLVTLAGSRMYTSMADTDDIIDDALERFERVLANID